MDGTKVSLLSWLQSPLVARHRRLIVVLAQAIVVAVSYVLSFLLRLDFQAVPWGLVLQTLPLLVVIRIASLVLFRLNRALWRYVSVPDVVQIVKATTAGSVVFALLLFLLFDLEGYPRSVFFLDWAGNIFLLSAVRVLVRVIRARVRPVAGERRGPTRRLLIIGAGDAGAALCREALSNARWRYVPVALIDDDPSKRGDSILGVPIVGSSADIGQVVGEYRPDLAVVAIPSATPEQRRRIVERCQEAHIDFRVLPGTPELIEGRSTMSAVRDVDVADLLGRAPANLDQAAIDRLITGKRIMVTGGAGSVGSELARQIAKSDPAQLILIDHAENPLFFLESSLRSSYGITPAAVIADVTDAESFRAILAEFRPEVLLHAAAHKHVPFMERSPAKAVRNNVQGTLTVARAAIEFEVEKFVLVSTDKAVRPSSVMGATKSLAELTVQELNDQSATAFITVRFGNVLGSNASVVPLFKEQIAAGGPVTVTHPDVTRFFMSLPEASGLILSAAALGNGGETFVLDMGTPIRIMTLAETLITLSGFECYKDIDIVITGLRPGEKLSEELYGEGELLESTGHDKLNVLVRDVARKPVIAEIERFLEALSSMEPQEVRGRLEALVPGYEPAINEQAPLS